MGEHKINTEPGSVNVIWQKLAPVEEEKKPEFRCPVSIIKDIFPHPNADRLEIAKVYDFNVVVRKGQYKVGDSVIYIPIDSILPNALEAKIFGPDSKIKLTHGRIKQIRIRQFASQGMLVDIADTVLHGMDLVEGQNVATLLNITKYEPPAPDFQSNQPRVKKERNKTYDNPYFHEYNGLENFKWYSDLFKEGQPVVYTCKIHGSNGRAGLLPRVKKTWWDKALGFFGLLPKYQFVYGSNKVQLQAKNYTGYYSDNIYAESVKKYDLVNKIKPHETVYYEIYGDGIQKNYTYGCKQGERKIVVFDVKVLSDDKQSTRWLSTSELKTWCTERDLPIVPYLYEGPHSNELAKAYTLGPSVLAPEQKIREGIVLKDPNETVSFMGKKYLKLLSEEYLDSDQTDFH